MTRFDEVARLREMEKKAEPGWLRGDMGSIYCEKSPDKYPLLTPYGINSSAPEVQIAVDLRNAAPWLLEAAACFQPGDAEILRLMRNYLAAHKPDGHLIENGPSTARGVDCMTRLQKAAMILEGME